MCHWLHNITLASNELHFLQICWLNICTILVLPGEDVSELLLLKALPSLMTKRHDEHQAVTS